MVYGSRTWNCVFTSPPTIENSISAFTPISTSEACTGMTSVPGGVASEMLVKYNVGLNTGLLSLVSEMNTRTAHKLVSGGVPPSWAVIDR